MKTTKFLAALAALTMTCTMLPVHAVPETVITVGAAEYGQLTYEVQEDGTIAVTGCAEDAVSVEIPAEIEGKAVTVIRTFAFSECKKLTEIMIPDSVTQIQDFAFSYCTDLTSVVIPNNVISIGNYVFCECESLKGFTIPDSVTSIGEGAFSGCTNLTDISIPDTVTIIRAGAFADCADLINITIPSGVTSIENSVFWRCTSLADITILNPDCDIYDDNTTINNGYDSENDEMTYTGTITGYEGSTAQAYAEKYGRTFVSLGEAPAPVPVYGDVNESGKVDIADVIDLCRASMGSYTLTEQGFQNADVNGDGNADTTDASYILQSLIGLTELPVEQ